MQENYEHYISRNISAYYKKHLFAPIAYLVFLLVLWILFPLGDLLMPPTLPQDTTFSQCYEEEYRYASCSFTSLTFTGYTCQRFGSTAGYYYYGTHGGETVIVLLSPKACEEGLPSITSLTISGQLMKSNKSYTNLLKEISEDLDWTIEGIQTELPDYYFSQPDFGSGANWLLFLLYFISGAYCLFTVLLYIVYIFFPVLSPTVQNLVVYGNPKKMLAQAEEELATLPQLATEDMFITEHYFIVTSPQGNKLVPIAEIVWIYKHSTLHKILWYHFSISYTLHILANKHVYIKCPKNLKSDIDGIMDYLAEANHDILVGFSEENRLKAEPRKGRSFHMEKLVALLHKRV